MAANTGDVDIQLGGEKVTLRCSLRAAKEVSATFGNYAEVFRKLGEFDHFAYVAIVAAGLGMSPKDVEADVYHTGLRNLVNPLSTYITLLSNGGRPPKDDDAKGAAAPGNA